MSLETKTWRISIDDRIYTVKSKRRYVAIERAIFKHIRSNKIIRKLGKTFFDLTLNVKVLP